MYLMIFTLISFPSSSQNYLPPSHNLRTFFHFKNNEGSLVRTAHMLFGVGPSAGRGWPLRGHTLKENWLAFPRTHQLLTPSRRVAEVCEPLSLPRWKTDHLDPAQLLRSQPQLPGVHEHSGLSCPQNTAAARSSWTFGVSSYFSIKNNYKGACLFHQPNTVNTNLTASSSASNHELVLVQEFTMTSL